MSQDWPDMAVRPGAGRARSELLGFIALALATANLVWTVGGVRRVERLSDAEPPYFFFLVIGWTAAIVALGLGVAVLWISARRVVDLAKRSWAARVGVYAAAASVLVSGGLLLWSFEL